MEKQQKILEMAKDICRVKLNCNDVCNPISACDALKYAERAVEAGYSKQSEGIKAPEKIEIIVRENNDDPLDFRSTVGIRYLANGEINGLFRGFDCPTIPTPILVETINSLLEQMLQEMKGGDKK